MSGMVTLTNDVLSIAVLPRGAELRSLKSVASGTEYLFNADPRHWRYSSPVLFPIVGGLVNDSYTYGSKTYKMPQHGFARSSDFTLTEQTDTAMTFRLTDSPQTLAVYPFAFVLSIGYALEDNRLRVTYTVDNPAESTLHFSIGGHPALACPFAAGTQFEDYRLVFDKPEKMGTIEVNRDGLLTHRVLPCLDDETAFALNYERFDVDTFVFKGLQSQYVTLETPKSKAAVRFGFGEFPILALWTKQNAPYICIEPWCGLDDYCDHDGDFARKPEALTLQGGGRFAVGYTIDIVEERQAFAE